MALTANTDPQLRDDEILSLKVQDNVHIYRGAIVAVDPATGYVLPASDASGYVFVGIAIEECDNTLTGHTAGGKRVRVQRRGSFIATAAGLAQTDLGKAVYASTDVLVALSTTHLVFVGVISEYISATSCRVTFSAPGSSGVTAFTSAATFGSTVGIAGAAAIAGHTDIGGGYGSSGADIGTDGAIRTNSTILADGLVTASAGVQAPLLQTVVDATDAVTIGATHYGKRLILTHATACAVTLPAVPAVGTRFQVALNGDDSLAVVISAASADTLVGKADAALDSVTYGAGHRIGALCEFWSDGTKWHVQNLSDCTMTYTS